MLKTRKRWVSLLTAVVMIAALVVPFVGTASATSSYSAPVVPVSAGGGPQTMNSYLTITLPSADALTAGTSFVLLDLPSDPSGFAWTVSNTVYAATGVIDVGDISITQAGTGQVTVAFLNNASASSTASTSSFSLKITSLTVPGGTSGDVNVTAKAQAGSAFSSSTGVPIANAGTGTVSLAAESAPTITETGGAIGVIDVEETLAGALDDTTSSLKFTLPSGFKWSANPIVLPSWGTFHGGISDITFDRTGNNGRDLKVSLADPTDVAVFFKLSGAEIEVDPSVAKLGDVVVKVGGDSDASPSELTVAKYGEYALTADVFGDTPTVTAGQAVELGKFQINEGVKGSLVNNRSIKLTLPSNLYWVSTDLPAVDSANSTTGGATIGTWSSVGSSGSVIQANINTPGGGDTNAAAKIVLKGANVVTPIDFTGPIDVTISGTEGFSGTLTLANVEAPVTVTAAAPVNVQIGQAGVKIGDFAITEVAAENISSTVTSATQATDTGLVTTATGGGDAVITVNAPDGVTFTTTPTATVTAGDLQIGSVTSSNSVTTIKIKSTSTTASTITLSNIQLTVNRTVPEGDVKLKVKGNAVDQNLAANGTASIYPNSTTAASAVVAKVTTNPQGGVSGTAVFKIGEASYTLNGQTVAIDVAPFIQDGRTFLPVRFIANSLGVDDSNILWDEATRKVTIINGSRVVQLTIGSNVLLLNGAVITMDVAPFITNGRTVLPVRFVAQAFGAQIDWDEAAQTVTVSY